jgi:hypothetical protein
MNRWTIWHVLLVETGFASLNSATTALQPPQTLSKHAKLANKAKSSTYHTSKLFNGIHVVLFQIDGFQLRLVHLVPRLAVELRILPKHIALYILNAATECGIDCGQCLFG